MYKNIQAYLEQLFTSKNHYLKFVLKFFNVMKFICRVAIDFSETLLK